MQIFRSVRLEQVVGVYDRGETALGEVSGARALGGCERGLGGVVLVEFGLDVVVYAGDFLWRIGWSVINVVVYKLRKKQDLLQGVDDFSNRLVGAIFNFVPLEGLEVGFHWFCRTVVS